MSAPHEVLGVEPGARTHEVRAAWRRLARATHPDGGGDPERFREAEAAYRALEVGARRPQGRPPTVVRRQGPMALAVRWWQRRCDRARRPRVV